MKDAFGGDDLPYDTVLEQARIKISKRRLRRLYRLVDHTVKLNSTVLVGIGALVVAGSSVAKALLHPHLLGAVLVLLVLSIATGTLAMFQSTTVETFAATYWATIRRRRDLAALDLDYIRHRESGEFQNTKTLSTMCNSTKRCQRRGPL